MNPELKLIKCNLLLTILFPQPSELNQISWPEKHIVLSYIDQFGKHKCTDCMDERVPYKHSTNDGNTNNGYTKVLIM